MKVRGNNQCLRFVGFTELSSRCFKPKEHEPSHLHALYGEHIGIFDLRTMQMTEGDLPKKAQELVKEWMSQNQDRLLEMWNTQKLEKLPPL